MAGEFDAAEQQFGRMALRFPHRQLEIFLGRIHLLREKPPEEKWEGVYRHTQK